MIFFCGFWSAVLFFYAAVALDHNGYRGAATFFAALGTVAAFSAVLSITIFLGTHLP